MRKAWTCIALFLLLAAGPACAGAWTGGKGKSYSKLSVSRFASDEGYDADGKVIPFDLDGKFFDETLTYYGEFGILENLSIFGSLPLKSILYRNFIEEGRTSGLYDLDLGVRFRVTRAPVVFSVQGLVKVPGGYDPDERLPLGNGQADAEARFLLGSALPSGRMYYGVEAGYRYRAEEPSDEYRYLAEVGGRFTRRLYGRAKVEFVRSAHNADDVRDVFGNPVAALEAERTALEATAGVTLSRTVSFELTYAPLLNGRNTAKGTTWSVAAILAF